MKNIRVNLEGISNGIYNVILDLSNVDWME